MKIYQGERLDIACTILDLGGARFDLGGYDIRWVAEMDDVRIDKSTDPDGGITILDAARGQFSIRLEPEDTAMSGRYRQEVRIEGSDLVRTVLNGILIIEPSLFGGGS